MNKKSASTQALPVLLYGCETWTVKASDARRITAAEMKYMRITAGYTWADYKTNSHIAKELEITPVLDKLLEYKRYWIQHVNRMPRDRLPRIMKHYSPTGRRNRGRPLKRLLDTWDRNVSTSGLTPWQTWWWWWSLLLPLLHDCCDSYSWTNIHVDWSSGLIDWLVSCMMLNALPSDVSDWSCLVWCLRTLKVRLC